MLLSLTKNITRAIFWFLIALIAIMATYVLGGYKHYSILKNNEAFIVEQVKTHLNVDLKYANVEENWDNLIPGIIVNQISIKDENDNILEAGKINIKFDLISFFFENKIHFRKIEVDNAEVVYHQPKSEGTSTGETFDLKILKDVNIDELLFNEFSLKYVTATRDYDFDNVILSYKDANKYVRMKYSDVNFYQYIDKNLEESRTVVRGDMKDIVRIAKYFDAQKYLDIAQYDKIYSVEGRIRAEVNFLNRDNVVNYNVNVRLTDNKVTLISEKMTVTGMKGYIYYTKEKGLFTNDMVGTLNGKPFNFSIANKDMKELVFNFEGYADKKTIDQYTSFFPNTVFSGGTNLKGSFISKESGDNLNIDTNLVGVKIEGLPILNKEGSKPYNLNISLRENNKTSYVSISGEGLQVFVDLKSKGKTQVLINRERIKFVPIKEDLFVGANVSNQNVDHVLAFIGSLNFDSNGKSKKADSDFNYVLDVNAKNTSYMGQTFEDVKVTNKGKLIKIDFEDKSFKGAIEYNLVKNILNGRFDRFYYVIDDNSTNSLASNNSFKVKDIPEMNIVVNDIKIKEYSGALSFNGKHVGVGYIIENIKGSINGLEPNFMFNIKDGEHTVSTELISLNDNILIQFEDIGDILSYYGYTNTMTSKSGVVKGKLNWDGLAPNLKTMNGNLHFQLLDGRINSASAGQKVLNVFRIFEVNTLNQIFMLDFDIVKSGIQYDSLIGGGKFVNGVFEISKKEPINMVSKSFNSSVTGKIDFVKEIFDNQLKIDLPISQKLPAVALIAGGPVAAAGVWVVDKIVGDKINSLMSISFGLKGSFNQPERI